MSTKALPKQDREILRRLAGELATIAALPVHGEKAEQWRLLNNRQPRRPMVWIIEIPWHEMEVDSELTLQCSDSWARSQEESLRRTLYQWHHCPADMIISDHLECPLAIRSTGYGLKIDAEVVDTDTTVGIKSRHYRPQITEPKDLEKIKLPVISHDEQATEENVQRMTDVYGGIMPIRKVGIKHIWYTPWDNLIRWWGVQEALEDLCVRPEMVHEAVDRCVASMNSCLDQLVKLNLLSLGTTNIKVGSGGYGYTDDLPGPNCDLGRIQPIDNWGCSNAQIFSEVSPEMHWEFALRHDLPWLERWGLNYYGCCEPLDFKMEILKKIPRLRKISMNYRINLDRAIKNFSADYVFSYKPNPAVVAEEGWRPDAARQELKELLEKGRGLPIEIIMKDISTAGGDPRRLWEWNQIAMELVEEFAG